MLSKAEILIDKILADLPFFTIGEVITNAEERAKIGITDVADYWFYIDFEDGDGVIQFEQSEQAKTVLETTIQYKLVAECGGLERSQVLKAIIACMISLFVTPQSASVDSEFIFTEEMGEMESLQKQMNLIKVNFTLTQFINYNKNCITQICEGC